MTEGNTCYRGGKPGVSDVFAASLWGRRLPPPPRLQRLRRRQPFTAAPANPSATPSAATSPAIDLVLAAPRRPFQTPASVLHADRSHRRQLRPRARSLRPMLFANHFAGATSFPIDFNPGSVNATAYAATLPTGQRIVAIINKDAHQSLTLDLPNYRQGPTPIRPPPWTPPKSPLAETLRQPRTLHPPPSHRRYPLRCPPLTRHNSGCPMSSILRHGFADS